MSATVLSLHHLRDVAIVRARDRVAETLKGVFPDRIPQAQARAERLIKAGKCIDAAVYQATTWALYAIDNPPPSAA